MSESPNKKDTAAAPPKQSPWPNKKQNPANTVLQEIFEGGRDGDPLGEIERIFSAISPTADCRYISQLHHDISTIFIGKYKGFRNTSLKYHDLRHTRNVVLAVIRLFHALNCQSEQFDPELLKLAITCAYFHDTGMLLTDEDPLDGSYLACHEERSIAFAQHYMLEHGYSATSIDNCAGVISCTNLSLDPASLHFSSNEIRRIGHVLGTADILAQMADRYYLESLPLLFVEQRDAGIQDYSSVIELMRQTSKFYHDVIGKRLQLEFANISAAMQIHFKTWHGLNRNLYFDFIDKNINYLEEVVKKYDSGFGSIRDYLRRKQPTTKV